MKYFLCLECSYGRVSRPFFDWLTSFFFSGKNEFPKFSSGGIFWVFSTQMEMLIFEFGKLQFPTNKKRTGIFFPNFRYLCNFDGWETGIFWSARVPAGDGFNNTFRSTGAWRWIHGEMYWININSIIELIWKQWVERERTICYSLWKLYIMVINFTICSNSISHFDSIALMKPKQVE